MKITAIQIRGLFEIFDYDIAFPQGESALIITGPNGFGKTMVLNIIFNLFSAQYDFFQKLDFKDITIILDEDHSIRIGVDPTENIYQIDFTILNGKTALNKVSIPSKPLIGIHSENLDADENLSIFHEILNGEKISYLGKFLPAKNLKLENRSDEEFKNFLGRIHVHMIREQRLFRKIPNEVASQYKTGTKQTLMIESIQTYADELTDLLAGYGEKSVAQTQQLDSSYPVRLRNEAHSFSQSEYEARYSRVAATQEKLAKFGLYRHEQEKLEYAEEDKKALTVYLKDLEIKLAVFADILEKLELFTTILNERRFNFKTIQISPDRGFYFKTSTGKELDLAQLSSGEQHEVVLLYELIFNVTPDTLVLIDEPEISLHISWQKEFLADLLRIIKIQNIQVIVATHSPAIINGRWDLTYNLEKKDAVA